jgi:hypothetical protein
VACKKSAREVKNNFVVCVIQEGSVIERWASSVSVEIVSAEYAMNLIDD